MNEKLEITVEKRPDDWHCCLADDSCVWESGRSKEEAIGKLMISLSVAGQHVTINQNRSKSTVCLT